jgi:hypothetical protein
MNGLREIRSRSNGNGRKEEVPENIDVVAVRDPGFELAGRQGFEPKSRDAMGVRSAASQMRGLNLI